MTTGLIAIVVVLIVIGCVVCSAIAQGDVPREASHLDGGPRSHVTIRPLPYDQNKETSNAVSDVA